MLRAGRFSAMAVALAVAGSLSLALTAAAADPSERIRVHEIEPDLQLRSGAALTTWDSRLSTGLAGPLGATPTDWRFIPALTNSGLMARFPADPVADASDGFMVLGANDSIEVWQIGTEINRADPAKLPDLWAGATGPCGTPSAHRGKPTVVYDRIGDRFFIGDIAYTGTPSNPTSDTFECLFVSKTANPLTGGYKGYSIPLGGVTGEAEKWVGEEPRMAVWPDRVYLAITRRGTSGTTRGSTWFAFNRQDVVAQLDVPRSARVNLTGCSDDAATTCGGWLPAHVRGSATVAASRPAPLVRMVVDGADSGDLEVRTWAINWTTLAQTVSIGALIRPAGGLQPACTNAAAHACDVVGQSGTTQKLDSRGWILGGQNAEFRSLNQALAPDQRRDYLTIAATVTSPSGTTTARWLQLDVTTGLSIAQDATPPPDAIIHRFQAAAATDKTGATVLAYSATNPEFPAQAQNDVYATHDATDAANTIGPEWFAVGGPGAQTNRSDFGGASLTVQPDGCRFWSTRQYVAGDNGWGITVGSFVVPGCGDATAPALTVTKPPPDASNNWYRRTKVTLTLDTSDIGGSGIAGPPACTNNGGAKVSATPVSGSQYTFDVTGLGGHVIRCLSADRAGNVKNATDVLVNLDDIPPSLSVTVPSPDGANGWFKTSPVPVTINASDGNSLVAGAPTCSDNAGTAVASTLVSSGVFRILVTGQGSHAFVCTVFDNAQNATFNQTLVTFKLDSVAPTASIVPPASITGPFVLTFAENVGAIAASTFSITPAGGSPLAQRAPVCKDASSATVSCGSSRVRSLTLKTVSNLAVGQTYAVAVAGAAPADAAGNALAGFPKQVRAATHLAFDSPQLGYRWGYVASPTALGGSYRRERYPGATWSKAFSGTSLTWFTAKGPNQGRASVTITNSSVSGQIVDTYAATLQAGAPVTFGALPSGSHTVTVRVLGDKNPASGGTFVAVDGYAVGGGSPVTDPTTTYAWPNFGAGSYAYSSLKFARVSATFYGTGIVWTPLIGPNNGKASVRIDGILVATEDLYGPNYVFVPKTYGGLANGKHTILIQGTGTRNPASTDKVVTLASLDVQ